MPIFEGIVLLLKEKFFFDRFYDWLVANIQNGIAGAAATFEQIIIFQGGAQGLSRITRGLGQFARKLQNGWLQTYGLIFILGWIALVVFLILGGVKA